MKGIISTYTFNAGACTVDFSSTAGFDINKLYKIVHNASNKTIYDKGEKYSLGYIGLTGSVLTLKYRTDSERWNNSDSLTVYYDSPVSVLGGFGNYPSPVVRTPGLQRVTTSGTVASGAKSVSFANVGSANATVLGATLAAGESVSWRAADQDTLGAFAYNATGTTLLIATIV